MRALSVCWGLFELVLRGGLVLVVGAVKMVVMVVGDIRKNEFQADLDDDGGDSDADVGLDVDIGDEVK